MRYIIINMFMIMSLASFSVHGVDEKQQTQELKDQLKSIQGRIKAYLNLPLRKYSKKDRSLVTKKLLQDTATVVGGALALYGAKRYFSSSTPQPGFIADVISIPADIRNITRPANWGTWANYKGDAITYADKLGHGRLSTGPSTNKAAFVATYTIGNEWSNDFIKVRVGYTTQAQADQFIRDMDADIAQRGLNTQYQTSNSVQWENDPGF